MPTTPTAPSRRRINTVLLALGLAVTSSGLACTHQAGALNTDSASVDVAHCQRTIILIDASSSARSAAMQTTAADLAVRAAVKAAICATDVDVALIAPGRTYPIVATSDVAPFTPTGGNERTRARRFQADDEHQLRTMVHQRLHDGYETLTSTPSSIAALTIAAADRSRPGDTVIVITDGVNQDRDLNLNRPLAKGEGATLAASLPPATLEGRHMTFVGVGEMGSTQTPTAPNGAPAGDASASLAADADTHETSTRWSNEIREFVAELCHQSNATTCTVVGSIPTQELLP